MFFACLMLDAALVSGQKNVKFFALSFASAEIFEAFQGIVQCMTTWTEYIEQGIPGRLEAARQGVNPTVITRMTSGLAVLGDSQLIPGYALLLADPPVSSLEDLPFEQRMTFLAEMARLGEALQAVTGCARVNYGVFGNTDPFLHAHVWARYDWEEPERRAHSVWLYPAAERFAEHVMFDPQRHSAMLQSLRQYLEGTG